MGQFHMKVAGQVARVNTLFESTMEYFRPYLTDEDADFTVTTTQADMDLIQKLRIEEALREGVPHERLPDPAVELHVLPVREDTYREEAAFVARRIRQMLDEKTLIRSREELDGWYAEHRDFYVIDSFEAGYTELEEDFFQAHDLILVMLEEEYGYVYHEPYYLNRQQDGKWELSFTAHYQQEDRTSDPMQWLFVIEIEKGLINETDAIEILPEPYAVPEETE